MKNERECGYTGKRKFSADEINREISKAKKTTFSKFFCRCKTFHLVIRRKQDGNRSGK